MLYNDQALTGRGERAYCYAVSYSSKLAICNVSGNVSDVFFIVIMMLCKTVVVGSDKGRKSALKEISCGRDVIDQDVLWQLLLKLSCEVGRVVRREELRGRVITLKIRLEGFETYTRQPTLDSMTCADCPPISPPTLSFTI
jgi:hypothetical protein